MPTYGTAAWTRRTPSRSRSWQLHGRRPPRRLQPLQVWLHVLSKSARWQQHVELKMLLRRSRQAGIEGLTADTDARAPKNDPHVQQLQRWLNDATTELASLRKRVSDQVGSPLRLAC